MPKEESLDFNRGGRIHGSTTLRIDADLKYYSYMDRLKRKVEMLWEYPERARLKSIGGTLHIDFSIGRDGKLERLALVESSGVPMLDDAALKALRDAAPFAPFPATWEMERLNISGTFIYQISVVR